MKTSMDLPRITDYEKLEPIGSGTFATVYRAIKKDTKECFAIKCVEKSSLSKSSIDNIITEIRLLKKLKHEHIVEMKDFMWDEKYIYIVMEYCSAGSLSAYIKQKNVLPEATCKVFLRQLALALKYMRDNDISHFDLKPQNLLLTKNKRIILKVADFGFAQYLELGQENTQIKGSPLYMAPEILLKHCYDASADLWSIGVILYECLFGKAPYSSKSLEELLEKIKTNKRIEIPKHSKISFECEDLLTRLLKRDPSERISFDDFFKHEFLDLKHNASEINLAKAVEIVNKAIDEDKKGNCDAAYHLYCEALQYFVPIIYSETDAAKKHVLRLRVQSYMNRAEAIKYSKKTESNNEATTSQVTKTSFKTAIESVLEPSQNYQQLYTVSSSSPSLRNGLEIGREAELYALEKRLDTALDSYKSALECLVPLLTQEPKGIRRDLLHQQIQKWMKEAESIKSLISAQNIEISENSSSNCCIQ